MQVVLADDHTLVRAGFRRLLEAFEGVEVVAEADNGLQVLDLVALHRPDVLILDVSMPGKNGLEVTGEVKEAYPEVGVLICSMHATLQYVKHALSVGASGFMVKDCAPAELQMALMAVAAGQTYVSQRLSGQMVDAMMRPAKAESGGEAALTPRQREVMVHLARGETTKQIAAAMNISVKTVETHRARMMETLGLRSGTQLVRFAIQHGYDRLESVD